MNSSLFYINGTAVPLTTSWSTGKLTIVDILKNLIILPVDIAKTATNIQSASQLYLSHVLSGNYWAIAYGFVIICLIYSTIALILPSPPQQNNTKKEVEEEEEPVVLRDFTLEQLRAFNGENGKPIYISLKHEVFDVSTAPEYYGKGQG